MVNSIIPSSPSLAETRRRPSTKLRSESTASAGFSHQHRPLPNRRINQTDASTEQTHQLRNEEEGRGRKRKGEKERERRTKLWFAS